MTLPQPSAFASLVNGFDGECPCCRRRFEDAYPCIHGFTVSFLLLTLQLFNLSWNNL